MPTAAQKYLAESRARGDTAALRRVVRFTFLISTLSAALISGLLFVAAPLLADIVFPQMGSIPAVVEALQFATAILLVQQMDQMYASFLKGLERFDIAARAEIAFRLVLISGVCLLALVDFTLGSILRWQLGASLCAALVKAALSHRTLRSLSSGRSAHVPFSADVVRFGLWVWLQSLAGALFQIADRLLIASLLGASALASYAILLQLTQQIHSLPAAALAFLLPYLSKRRHDSDATQRVRRIGLSVLAGVVLSTTLAVLLALLGERIVTWWVGDMVWDEVGQVFLPLLASYYLLALNVAPHYLLLAHGRARLVAVTNMAGGLAVLAASVLLIPSLEVLGAAFARLLYGPAIAWNYTALGVLRKRHDDAQKAT
jgi:O-antigen/teichoic acid export membrane protein